MVLINCPCGHKWNYKGDSKFYATCPMCMRKRNIEKHRVRRKVKKASS